MRTMSKRGKLLFYTLLLTPALGVMLSEYHRTGRLRMAPYIIAAITFMVSLPILRRYLRDD